MKLFILFVMFCTAGCAQIKTVYIKDFGAKPGDHISDQAAFNKASDYINKRKGNVKLVLDAGTYLAGPPYNYKISTAQLPLSQLWDVMPLSNCKNVTIEGKGKVTIKFLDNIPFGCVPYRADKKDSSVHIGSLFRLISCSNVTIRNINADGNNLKFRLLHKWGIGPNPYEREHEGLFILNCQGVTVQNSNFNYFGRDGMMILEDRDKQPVQRLKFENCNFNYNGRDGVSWCGGEDVSFYNCNFNYNATTRIITNPGCGIDIEPERGAECKNGRFVKCTFASNGGYGIVSMNADASSKAIFDSCKIYGNTNYSMVSNSPYFTFYNSEFAGTAIFSYDSPDEAKAMKAINCTFKDTLPGKKVFREGYMVSIKGRYIRFNNCNFTSYVIPSVYTEIRKKAKKDDPENTLFTNCVFSADFKKITTWGAWPFLVSHSQFVDCTFKSGGVADFKGILGQGEKNISQKNGRFLKL